MADTRPAPPNTPHWLLTNTPLACCVLLQGQPAQPAQEPQPAQGGQEEQRRRGRQQQQAQAQPAPLTLALALGPPSHAWRS
jgi:hypothetical protein